MEVKMKKIKTVKQVRTEKWYYELHTLSSALHSWVGCTLIMLGIMLNICFLALVMCSPTVSARENFTVCPASNIHLWVVKDSLVYCSGCDDSFVICGTLFGYRYLLETRTVKERESSSHKWGWGRTYFTRIMQPGKLWVCNEVDVSITAGIY